MLRPSRLFFSLEWLGAYIELLMVTRFK